MKTPSISYLTELGETITETKQRCADNKWWGAKFWVGVIADIFADVKTHLRAMSAKAHKAETYANESSAALEAGLQGLMDGKIDACDVQQLRRALKLSRNTATISHDISEEVAS